MEPSPKMPRPHVSRLCLTMAALLALAGCAGTRALPITATTPAPAVSRLLSGVLLYAEPFRVDQTVVGGGHHEGLAQIRQPWIWGISDSQRAALYGNLEDVVRYAFLDELNRLGLKVRLAPGEGTPGPGLAISGAIKRIELNTFGRGLSGAFEGFGSAGNYWEARIALSDLRVVDTRRGEILWQGDLEQYAKLADSPVKLEMTHFDLLANSLQLGLAGSNPLKIADAVKQSRADYKVGSPRANPVELAARLAARDLAGLLAERLERPLKSR